MLTLLMAEKNRLFSYFRVTMGNCLQRLKGGKGYDNIEQPAETVRITEDAGQSAVVSESNVTLHSQPSTSVKTEPVSDSKSHLTFTLAAGSADFPFLVDKETVQFISQSHTMFIMRGVPGSGKSTIVKLLQEKYPVAKVCSADDFFVGPDGIYRWDKAKLSDAHSECQKNAEKLCIDETPVIVIDNTNLQKKSIAHYVNLAHSLYHYHVCIVEPRTPWKDDPAELAKQNKHDVTEEIVIQKIQTLKKEKYVPLYYAWFFSRKKSQKLSVEAWKHFPECFSVFSEMKTFYALDDNKELTEALKGHFSPSKPIMHCTAKFVGGSYLDNSYQDREIVKNSLGKAFALEISGFIFTPRTIGARVRLSQEELELYDNEEDKKMDKDLKRAEKLPDNEDSKQKIFMKGFSAHVTIGTADGIPPKVTGDDLREICQREFLDGVLKTSVQSYGTLKYLGDGLCELVLSEPLSYTSLFTGFYPRVNR